MSVTGGAPLSVVQGAMLLSSKRTCFCFPLCKRRAFGWAGIGAVESSSGVGFGGCLGFLFAVAFLAFGRRVGCRGS